jgi:signal transduction histidine kinase
MWLMWWLGDACGILLFTPLLYAWVRPPSRFHSTPRLLEWFVVTGFSIFLGWYTFVFEQLQPPGEFINIMFLVTPFLLWASIRLGLRGATLVSLIACGWVLWGAAAASGPFAMENVRMAGMIESSFILVITLTALVVQALFREHTLDLESIGQANEALTERVRQRTAELQRTNEELMAARDTAEQANASKTRFLVAASHDLRQPLQAIMTHTDILGMHSNLPEITGNVEQLQIANRCMTRILDKLADISRIESGDVTTDISVFAVDSLLDELRQQHSQEAASKGLPLEITRCDRTIRSDYTLLLQILQNLISNAIRYTECGSITVECHSQDETLRIAVKDSGPGIREADKDIIFEEFYQLDNPARSRDRGMGMGLAIVRRLTSLLGLPLHLNSVPGQGSTFTIDVPLAGKEPVQTGNIGDAGTGAPAAQRATVLLIDDEPAVLHSQEMLLQTMGFCVLSAADTDSARRLAGSGDSPPDLIITDYRLPEGETGSELIEQLREESGWQCPAIILTGDMTLARSESEPASCLLLKKPVTISDLQQAINQQLGSRTGQPRTAEAD